MRCSPDLNPTEEFFIELKSFTQQNWPPYKNNSNQRFGFFLQVQRSKVQRAISGTLLQLRFDLQVPLDRMWLGRGIAIARELRFFAQCFFHMFSIQSRIFFTKLRTMPVLIPLPTKNSGFWSLYLCSTISTTTDSEWRYWFFQRRWWEKTTD